MKRWHVALAAALIIVALFLADGGATYVKQLLNRPPKAAFTYRTPTRTLKYIAPTDQDTIMFLNNSTDPDGDPLAFSWFVNDTLQSGERDFQTKLPPGLHTIRLVASDGRTQSTTEVRITVERGAVFPVKRLKIPIKGINYRLDKRPPSEEIEECLTVIRNDLGCNGVKLMSGYEDTILEAARIAIRQGFKEVILNPRFEWTDPRDESFHIEDHVSKISAFASRSNELVGKNSSIILCVGDELTHSVRGIANSSTMRERIAENLLVGWKNQAAKENAYLERIVKEVRKKFKGRITYASSQGMYQYLDWGRLDLDIVAPHMYYATEWYTERSLLSTIEDLKRCGKPIYVSEFGCAKYVGAAKWGGDAWRRYTNEPYSQEEQAENICQTLEIFQQARVQAVYLWCWLEYSDDIWTYGVVRYRKNGPYDRTLGFYMYKSFVLSNPPKNLAGESSAFSFSAWIPLSSFQPACPVVQLAPIRTVREKRLSHASSGGYRYGRPES